MVLRRVASRRGRCGYGMNTVRTGYLIALSFSLAPG